MKPIISIIITTKNEHLNIENCLLSIVAQTFPKNLIEIIVVDNHSSDHTVAIARKFTNLVYSRGPERSAQRNFGIRKSQGQYILYLDADMRLSKNVISDATSKMNKDRELTALYIGEKVVVKNFLTKILNFERSFYDMTPIDAVRFIKKDVFLKVGGFDEKLDACEDWDLDKRLRVYGNVGYIKGPIFHDVSLLNLNQYLNKKKQYSKSFQRYTYKWGRGDPDIKKQFGAYYRFLGVLIERGKWKKILSHPFLFCAILMLRFLVGWQYFWLKLKKKNDF